MAYLNGKIKALAAVMLLCGSMQLPAPPARAASLPTMAAAGITDANLAFPDTREGIVMQVLGNNLFVMNESVHFICSESEINGKTASTTSLRPKQGNRLKVTRYRINKKYFVSSMTILQ